MFNDVVTFQKCCYLSFVVESSDYQTVFNQSMVYENFVCFQVYKFYLKLFSFQNKALARYLYASYCGNVMRVKEEDEDSLF